MGRAWTLQEGNLARRCLVQFEDCVLDTRYMNSHASRRSRLGRNFVMGTTVWAVFGTFWKKHYHWRVFDSDAGRMIKDRISYRFMRFMATIIQSAFVFALFPICNLIHRENVHFWQLSLERDDWQLSLEKDRPREGLPFNTANGFIAHEICRSIKESLGPPAVKSILGYAYPSEISADRFRIVWNALVGRSTTKPEDLHIVLANLLGFNAGYMIQEASEPSQRMTASKFTSIGLSPVEILHSRNAHHSSPI